MGSPLLLLLEGAPRKGDAHCSCSSLLEHKGLVGGLVGGLLGGPLFVPLERGRIGRADSFLSHEEGQVGRPIVLYP